MELKEILAVSGQPGLWKFVAQGTRGVIVEALEGGRRMNVPSDARVSALADISVFTLGGERSLAEVFTTFYAHTGGKPTVGHKEDARKIEAEFAAALPDYDPDRVHTSDMKKMVQWYNILLAAGMTEFKVPEE